MSTQKMPWWAWTWPILAWGVLATTFAFGVGGTLVIVADAAALIIAVFAAVYHAEVVGERVGEPFGSLVLALVITVVEVALIVSVMLNGGPDAAGLARDTMFATVMIILNGLIGLSLLLGGLRHHEQGFQVQGAGAALAVLAAIVTLTLVLPNFTTSVPGPVFTTPQLGFAGIVSLVLYCGFMFVQTVRHRDHFLYPSGGDEGTDTQPPSLGTALLSTILLLTSLVAIAGLAKTLTPALNAGVTWLGTPKALLGIVIALLVLLPESVAALRAAYANQLQASMNLAFRSALASVGLTIPAISLVAIMLGQPLALGLGPKEIVLLALTLLISVMTFGTGRTTVLQGAVHLVILASFLFLAVVP